eukprot:IDg3284t1
MGNKRSLFKEEEAAVKAFAIDNLFIRDIGKEVKRSKTAERYFSRFLKCRYLDWTRMRTTPKLKSWHEKFEWVRAKQCVSPNRWQRAVFSDDN